MVLGLLGAGVEPGDEVIAVANSDMSNTNAIDVWNDAPSIFLFDGINTAGHTAKLHGIYSDGAHMTWQLKYAWFSE